MGVKKKKKTSHCFLLCFVLESVGLNVFSARFEKFSLIIEADENVFFIKTFRPHDATLISLFISKMFLLIIGRMKKSPKWIKM